jgi:hypothetical protein
MANELAGRRIAFLTANEGIEQVVRAPGHRVPAADPAGLSRPPPARMNGAPGG